MKRFFLYFILILSFWVSLGCNIQGTSSKMDASFHPGVACATHAFDSSWTPQQQFPVN